jgi:hypothetical protein
VLILLPDVSQVVFLNTVSGERMTPIFKWTSEYFGFVSNGCLFDSDGAYMGWVADERLWDSNGAYRGQIVDENYVLRNEVMLPPIARIPRIPPIPPIPPVPALDRIGRVPRVGWVDALDYF